MPHLALPALSSYLRSAGVEVIQRDINVEVFDRILTRTFLEQSIGRLREMARRPSAHQAPRDRVQWALAEGPRLAAEVENAVRVLRSPAFFDGPAGRQAFLVIAQSLDLASLPFHPSSLDLLSFVAPAPVSNSHSLLRAIRNPHHNIFLDLFRRHVIPDIVRAAPDIVGISIPTEGQMFAAMTLAHLVKQSGLRCHVTVGGPHVTMLRQALPRTPALFGLIDSAVLFEGEEPLLRLAETLQSRGDLATVPNLIWRDGPAVRVNEAVALPGAVSWQPRGRPSGDAVAGPPGSAPRSSPAPAPAGLPDFDGLPLDLYLAPHLVLPLLTAHGCYHGDCAFCNVGYGRSGHFKPVQPALVVEQMQALQRKYGVRHIFFADEAMTPHSMREMSKLLEAHTQNGGAPIHWCGCMRFEKAITGELLEKMSAAGCRMILFGLETASPRMIELMDKGTKRETMSRILKESTAAGIWNHTFFFFGFPTETLEDAQDTVNFVFEHGEVIHSGSPGEFVLERYSPVHLAPQEFGVQRVIQKPEEDLAIYFEYVLESGLDESTAKAITEHLLDALPGKRYGQYYAQDAYRLLYAGHLREVGQPLPPWLMDEA
jgi:radical SAM superfamily enzyme YgiQ (UPF0313 family)